MITIIIPTFNPNIDRLQRTIDGIVNQTFTDWECVIIDNNSTLEFSKKISINNKCRIVKETKQGLTYARLRGFYESNGEIIVMADDDNVLQKVYLQNLANIFNQEPKIGALGGNIAAEFENKPPEWSEEFWGKLAIRNLGSKSQVSDFKNAAINHYPIFAPVGAGMAIRKEALKIYISDIESQTESISDRKGNSLSSSGDNEIVMYVLKSGYEVGFFPELNLTHLIPATRLTKDYFARLNEGIMNSWTKFMLKHNICPWQQIPTWTLNLRKIKAYFTYKAWQNPPNYIHWRGACGMFEGLAK